MSGRYVLVGDSQAVGMRGFLREALATKGWQEAGAAVHVGWTTRRMVASGQAAALGRARPDLAIVVLGGNDTATRQLPEHISALVAQLRPAQVLWVGPAVVARDRLIHQRKREVAAVQAREARRLGFRWIDGGPMTEDLRHAHDGLHFRREARRRWAQRIAAAVGAGRRWVPWAATAAVFAGFVAVWWATRRR